MTRYNEPHGGGEGDLLQDMGIMSYREGVDRVLEYVESIHAYPRLVAELKWAIDEGII